MPLPGSDKYRVSPPPKALTWEQAVIEKANNDIRIEDVLAKYYQIYVPYEASSWKVMCPWALEHDDGGLDKQFRVYSDSNTGYCFAIHGRVDNLRLFMGVTPYVNLFDAAKAFLDEYEIDYRRKSYQEVFAQIAQQAQAKIEYEDLVSAMQIYLHTLPEYDQVEYNLKFLDTLERFNNQARVMCSEATDVKEVQEWYQKSKDQITDLLFSLIG